MLLDKEDREIRVLNRNFSLGEYGESWTKLERYLFIEIYNVVKDFYLANSSDNIEAFSGESISLILPLNKLDTNLFKAKNKSRDLLVAAEGLSKKQISITTIDREGQYGFDFISIFPRITYNPVQDKKNMYVRIQSEVYEQMVPIESYCQLDLKLISEFNSGNTIRLYEIFKSHAFRKTFEINFNDLRKQLGFFNEGNYQEWKHFNAKVLKPAVKNINTFKQYDIEVFYKKARSLDKIVFEIKTHNKTNAGLLQVLNLNERINNERIPNLIQQKYIETVIKHCQKSVAITSEDELMDWIISDLISQQNKQNETFNFKHSINAISKQIRAGVYTKPYIHQYLANNEETFDHHIYDDIKRMEQKGFIEDILKKYTVNQIKANHFGYLLNSTTMD